MTKIVTAPRKLNRVQFLARDVEIKIQRIYALGSILTLRQRSTIIRTLLVSLITPPPAEWVDQAKARVVGDSVVVSLTKKVLQASGIQEGDELGFAWSDRDKSLVIVQRVRKTDATAAS